MRFFKSRRGLAVLAAIATAVAVAVRMETNRASATESARQLSSARAFAAGERTRLEQDIKFYERRAAEDTISAADRSTLASLYLERSRETGDFSDVTRAETLARKSLALREAHNSQTKMVLASSLLEQHRFQDALVFAEELLQEEPSSELYQAVVAEIRLEIGDYDTAASMFASLKRNQTSLVVAPRLARWEEIRGHDRTALNLLKGARDSVMNRTDLPRGQLAWFDVRLGEHQLRAGDTRNGEATLREALKLAPDDPRVLAAMARFEASARNWSDLIEIGERSLDNSVDPGTLGLLADAYRAKGNAAKAAEYDRVIDAAFVSKPGPFHRSLSLYLLDQNRQVPLVLAKAQQEIHDRHDVYGYDVLAWALYRSGRIPEAEAAMKQALHMGTNDPLLQRHAKAITASLPK